MNKKLIELLNELRCLADLQGDGFSFKTDVNSIALRFGYTVGKTRRMLYKLVDRNKIKIVDTGERGIVGGNEILLITVG